MAREGGAAEAITVGGVEAITAGEEATVAEEALQEEEAAWATREERGTTRRTLPLVPEAEGELTLLAAEPGADEVATMIAMVVKTDGTLADEEEMIATAEAGTIASPETTATALLPLQMALLRLLNPTTAPWTSTHRPLPLPPHRQAMLPLLLHLTPRPLLLQTLLPHHHRPTPLLLLLPIYPQA